MLYFQMDSQTYNTVADAIIKMVKLDHKEGTFNLVNLPQNIISLMKK